MEGILHAASEVKDLLVHEVDKHLGENNGSSSSSSSSDQDEAPPADTESAVVALNDDVKGSSSSSSTDEEAPTEDLIILPTTVVVQDSGAVAVSEAQSISETNYEVAAESEVQVEAIPQVIDESESSESDEKVLPIEEEEEEEETLVAEADSLATGVLVSKETEDSPPQNIPIVESTVDEHTDKHEIPENSGSPELTTTVTHQVRSPTSWMSCCGLFEVLRRNS